MGYIRQPQKDLSLSKLLPSKLVQNILKEINNEAPADPVKEEPGTIEGESGKLNGGVTCPGRYPTSLNAIRSGQGRLMNWSQYLETTLAT